MNSMNRFSITGRLTKNPELKELENGNKVVNITLAVDRPYKKDGEKITDFLPFSLWNKDAENICQISKKGSLINLEGSSRVKEVDVDGHKTSTIYMNVENYTHLAAAKDYSNNEVLNQNIEKENVM